MELCLNHFRLQCPTTVPSFHSSKSPAFLLIFSIPSLIFGPIEKNNDEVYFFHIVYVLFLQPHLLLLLIFRLLQLTFPIHCHPFSTFTASRLNTYKNVLNA
jgi:hypothetical protein